MKSSLIPFNEDLLMIIVEKFLEEDEKGALFKYINFALFPQSKSNTGFMREPEPDSLSRKKNGVNHQKNRRNEEKKGGYITSTTIRYKNF